VPSRLDHVTITAGDFAASLAFYDAALSALGWSRTLELGDEEEDDPEVEAVGWGAPDSDASLWLVTGTVPTAGLHLALQVGSAAMVETFHSAAIANGGTSHDAPRRWAIIRRGQFNAIVADPDGNLIEAVAPE
jgi:catechol 2,3-dioxygenase-like lactoylglutathione lyase family enzyme